MNIDLDPPASNIIEVFLQPGEYYFGDRHTRIRTLLGSCVSIVIWHPLLLIGGMCHFLLPVRSAGRSRTLDGRYADEALQLLLQEVEAAGTHPAEYQVKLFGGGNMFPDYSRRARLKASNGMWGDAAVSAPPGSWLVSGKCGECHLFGCGVGCLNSAAARSLLQRHGLAPAAEHIGGDGHRQVIFDIGTGHTWVRQTPVSAVSR